jgi:ribosomal protein L37AE/L43A
MSQNPHSKHAVRRIVLPSGRTIEVIRFKDVDADRRELHVCPSCESDLVQPMAWSETPDGRWDLALECPNCGRSESGTFTRLQVEKLEDHLDEGLTEMIADLQRLTQANMAADVDRFVAALDAGFILPEDF